MACPPPEFDWSLWATWSCLREDIAPIATFIGAVIVAWAALAQAKTARERHEEQTKADRERRITESFGKAVEQLGSDKLATSLGGIYTLERISRESEREYWPIMEMLTAYVRERARWSERKEQDQDLEIELDLSIEWRPAKEVQAILTVLGRREERVRNWERKDQRLDLSKTDLRGADLKGAHLERSNLVGAHLEHANLMGAHLQETDFIGARLQRARLTGAHLERTNLHEAHFQGATLRNAHLEDAILTGVYFHRANLRGAHLERATDLTQEQINSASGDDNTTLPEGLERPAHWTKR